MNFSQYNPKRDQFTKKQCNQQNGEQTRVKKEKKQRQYSLKTKKRTEKDKRKAWQVKKNQKRR